MSTLRKCKRVMREFDQLHGRGAALRDGLLGVAALVAVSLQGLALMIILGEG